MESWHFTSKSTLVHLIETLSMALEKICHDSTLSLLSSILYPKGKYYKNMLIARFPFITRIQTRKHSNASSITQATTGLIGAPWIEETRRWKTTCGFQTKMEKAGTLRNWEWVATSFLYRQIKFATFYELITRKKWNATKRHIVSFVKCF